MEHGSITILAGIGAAALLAQWLAWRTRLPAIVYLLAAGILLGPVAGWLDPDALLGPVLFPFISLAVAVILFEGSLTLDRREIAGHGSVVRNMVSFGFVVTWAVAATAARVFVDLPWSIAILFGAIMIVTGPTVIVPMLRAVRPNARVASILRWEGILIDPIGAVLAVLVFNLIVAAQFTGALGETAVLLGRMVAAGVLIGAAAGYAWGYALRALWVPGFLERIATLLLVFVVFALADAIEAESGLLAVTVMGIWLANMPGVHLEDILDFKETLSLLLISGLFILLAARLDLAAVAALGWPALGVFAAIQFVARPLKVWLCAKGSDLSIPERAALAWIAPRGIVAAAIAALFAIRLAAEGLPGADALVPLSFVVIVGTVLFQGLTAARVVRWLGVQAPPPEGLLIAGSGPVALAIARTLHEHDLPVLIADTVWEGIREARMAGLRTYFGNPASDHAARNMDLTGIGKVVALSRRSDFNDLVSAHFAGEFGREAIFHLPITLDDDAIRAEKYAISAAQRGRRLFGQEVSLSKLASVMGQGASIRVTRLSEEFDFESYLEQRSGRTIPLFAWDRKGTVRMFTATDDWIPGAGWQVAAMILPAPEDEASATPETGGA